MNQAPNGRYFTIYRSRAPPGAARSLRDRLPFGPFQGPRPSPLPPSRDGVLPPWKGGRHTRCEIGLPFIACTLPFVALAGYHSSCYANTGATGEVSADPLLCAGSGCTCTCPRPQGGTPALAGSSRTPASAIVQCSMASAACNRRAWPSAWRGTPALDGHTVRPGAIGHARTRGAIGRWTRINAQHTLHEPSALAC